MKKKTLALIPTILLIAAGLLCFCGCLSTIGCVGCLGCLGTNNGGQTVDITDGASETPAVTDELYSEEPISEEPTLEPGVTPEPTPAPIVAYMRSDAALIKVNSRGTYGVASDGSIRFTGRAVSGQNLIYDWDDVVGLAVNEKTTAILTRGGTVKITGDQQKLFADALKWTGLVDIAMGDEHMIGLRADGTLLACGNKTGGRCYIDDWSGVKKVAAAGNYTIGLTDEGVLTTLGSKFGPLVNAKPVADIEAASDHVTVLYQDGTASSIPVSAALSSVSGVGRTTDNEAGKYDLGWSGIVKVFAGEGSSFGVDAHGKLYTDSKLITEEVSDVYYVAASKKHAVVLLGTGKCRAFGDNTHLQSRVTNWRLLPYVDPDGYLLGLRPGMYIGGEKVATGLKTTWTEPATGVSKEATCLLLGDVNGDGLIDHKDAASVRAHIAKEVTLSGSYLRAANIIKDGAKPNSIDALDLERLEAEAEGRREGIDQYAKTDSYTDLLAAAKRKNSDAEGYITIRDTNISYPIMYDFNWYYNDHDIDRNEIVRGSIYFYWGEPNGNIVITGHNSRTSGTMFHQLHKVQNNKSSLKTYRDRVWAINTYGATGYWEVWSLYEEPAFSDPSKSSQYFNTCFPGRYESKTEQEKQEWIDYQQRKSELGYTVNVTTKDRFMTLLTCGDSHADSAKGSRLYIFLRWVGED